MAKVTKIEKVDFKKLQKMAEDWMESMGEGVREDLRKNGLSYDSVLLKFPALPQSQREYIRGYIDGSLGYNP